MKEWMTSLRKEFFFVAIAVFAFVNLAVRHNGGGNAASRYAQSLGMIVNHSFFIDGFEGMTIDWAKTPDGHYYSNKAPGPSLAGLPIAWIVDVLMVDPTGSNGLLYDERMKYKSLSLSLQSIALQVIPCIFLAIFMDRRLRQWGYSNRSRSFALLALLFGNTASMYQNTMFGHAIAANALLAAFLFTLDRKLVWGGFLFGIALLSDYLTAFSFPGFVYIVIRSNGKLPAKIKDVFLGAVIPAALWIWYHTMSFGSPFITAQKYLAPEWADVPAEKNALWGVISSTPSFDVALKLLIGIDRGILVTQPWVLFSIILGIPTLLQLRKNFRNLSIDEERFFDIGLVVTSFFLLLWLGNASFNGWHGGETIGPRYLSVALVLCCPWGAMVYERSTKFGKACLSTGLLFSIIYYAVAFPQDVLTPFNPWLHLTQQFLNRSIGMQIRVLIPGLIVLWCWNHYWRKQPVLN